jgi:hypothetical protein
VLRHICRRQRPRVPSGENPVINCTVVPTQSGSRKQQEASAYDVRVMAFDGDPARTLQGLCDGFGIDRATAQRVLAAGPAVLRRGVSAAEAQECARLLGGLGARVRLEAAVQAVAAQSAQPLAAADLEFDVLSALEAALDPDTTEPATRDLGRELQLEASEGAPETPGLRGSQRGEFDLSTDDLDLPVVASRRPHRDEFDIASEQSESAAIESRRPVRDEFEFEGAEREASAGSARRQHHDEFELEAAATRQLDLELETAPRKRSVEPDVKRPRAEPQRADTGPKPVMRPRAPEASRPTVQEQAAPRATTPAVRSRDLPLLQILVALAVAAIGHWLDSSVIYGNAGVVSVIAHGLAFQQLVLGVRGLLR